MPLYEYRCTACGFKFEKIQKFSDEPDTVCPKCQGELIRPMTAPALRFAGAGWYVNDYAGKGGAPAGDAPAASGSGEGASKDTKTETKTDSGGSSDAPASTPSAPVPPTSAASSTSSGS